MNEKAFFPALVVTAACLISPFLITQIKAGFVRVSVDGGDLPDRCERQECGSLGL